MSMGELLLLALVGFFVIGPERLPAAIRAVAGMVTQAKQYATAVKDQVGEAADLAEVRRQLDELREPLAEIRSADPRRAWREALRDELAAPPTPAPTPRPVRRSQRPGMPVAAVSPATSGTASEAPVP
ncbi:Sec-independent protein translocase protein TatB [Actinomycetospora chibensis]|uniref:Sec-independent protein translocase protein TatB n=1 Tax=Actinomycetospora chibensis TaxID=663606 RepID=A0ABV9RC58_9PSEU|nr:Sec-independent protein translocase protein TatB [Actinomycetospora chibensis]MDD7926654.1 Sec-independent protein translocase protein TatB [Actinomycetospora chibensis]